MEHGLDGSFDNPPVSGSLRNGVSPVMANFPDAAVAEGKENKSSLEVVGEHSRDGSQFEDLVSSESDALVIDEKLPKKKRASRKYNKKSKESPIKKDCNETDYTGHNEENNLSSETKDLFANSSETVRPSEVPYLSSTHVLSNENTQTSDNFSAASDSVDPKASETETSTDHFKPVGNSEIIEHSNPYFHESLFELSQLSQLHHLSNENLVRENDSVENIVNVNKPAKPKRQLKEYAQYLGLQPAVQFKCPKCGKSGFESLTSLQEHIVLCSAAHQEEEAISANNVSGFKITRKVFLCSTCGTYYENWNLYLHMLEHHKRYICLYCLGMFSALDDLCQHIQSRHNVEPGVKDTLDDFYNTYNDPCYIVCCECNKQFQEGDDFIHHQCLSLKVSAKPKSRVIKQVIAPENHITGDYGELSDIDNAEKTSETVKHSAPEENMELDKGPSEEPKDGKQTEEILPVTNNEGDNIEQSDLSDNDMKSDNDNSDVENHLKDASEDIKSVNDNDDSIDQEACKGFEEGAAVSDKTGESDRDSPYSSKHLPSQENTENTMDGVEDQHSDEREELPETPEKPVEVETRKVPKLSLKLPKLELYTADEGEDLGEDSNISNASNEELEEESKPNLEISNIESENEEKEDKVKEATEEPTEDKDLVEATHSPVSEYPIADSDISINEIELDQPLDKIDISVLLQKCLSSTAPACIYCNHSRKIAVNGKQLGLHAIAEHRFSAINKSITEEELTPMSFNVRIEECLSQLEDTYFNLESGASGEAVTFSHVFECFQCHYSTTVHKELYLHNRKFHSKNLLLCIMCKTIFYSYSELICHLCPGVYILGHDTQFRCCMCVSDHLPSSFRLMVHLRKRHNVCDVCLEMCHGQYKLSNHVWKHKLHHFCYRCGIAYRNKPDITRHLFWKHGTESVLCKKCLQKKWPHVYHFCVPPLNFACEECNLIFTRAVSLKVHKRIHTGEKKHPCTWEACAELFISKKIMLKHLKSHTEPPEEIVTEPVKEEEPELKTEENDAALENKQHEEVHDSEEPPKPVKPKVDVYDLPELNLSESESSDSESEQEKPKVGENCNTHQSYTVEENLELTDISGHPPVLISPNHYEQPLETVNEEISNNNETLPCISKQSIETSADTTTMQDIWDNFKNYQANKEKLDNILIGDVDLKVDKPYVPDIPIPEVEEGISAELALRDHDYCSIPEKADAIVEVKPSLESTESMDHDYCFFNESEKKYTTEPATTTATLAEASLQPSQPSASPRKRNSSTSSTSSGSDSSCSCGSNCSCSDSSSGSSSSTSDSSNSDSSTEDGRKRQLQRRLKRKERSKAAKKQAQREAQQPNVEEIEAKPVKMEPQPVPAQDMPIRESDLETTESETDEEFYDREPLKFAKKILAEKRAQLIADVGTNLMPNGSFIESTSRPPTPPAGTIQEEESHSKRKKKTKKRKKRKSERKAATERTYISKLIIDPVETVVPPPPPSVPYYQQFHQTIQAQSPPVVPPITLSLGRNSPVRTSHTPPMFTSSKESSSLASQDGHLSDSSGNLRASKRRRVPNKFYGYSSDEEDRPQSLKRSKVEINRTIPAPSSPMLVPPITIKTVQPALVTPQKPQIVEPITLKLPKPYSQSNEYSRSHRKPPMVPPLRISAPRVSLPPPPLPPKSRDDSATESNDSDVDEPPVRQPVSSIADVPKATQPQLYCYCRCPYDEVSEMIGCDSSECDIEWFHFECVGIMVPPKGQWFCPDCRKKKQQRLYS